MIRKTLSALSVWLFLLVFLVWVPSDEGYGQAPATPSKTITSQVDSAPMILIPGGPFTFGMDQSKLKALLRDLKEPFVSFYADELPEATTTVDDFYIDQYETTNERYDRFVKETKHRKPAYWDFEAYNRPKQPVVGIGWSDAEQYCKWAGKRLPSEMQWEKAARGTDKRIWSWGKEPDDKKYNGRGMGMKKPIDVGSFPAGNSFYGVSDMAGNVWEMTSSQWPNEKSPKGRVMKGGSFLNTPADVRAMVRWAPQNEEHGATWLGFRCVMYGTSAQK